MPAELCWGKYRGVGNACAEDMELFDQGKQPSFVDVSEWFVPFGSLISVPGVSFPGNSVQEIGTGDEGVMEMRNGDDVPGVTGQGACKEAALVVDEMRDDHFEDLHREPG